MSIGTIWTYRDLIKREQGLEAAIEFEQVVKKYQAEQIGIEQERIIKLLEDNAVTYNLIALDGKILEHTAPLAAPLDKVIALIKGENN